MCLLDGKIKKDAITPPKLEPRARLARNNLKESVRVEGFVLLLLNYPDVHLGSCEKAPGAAILMQIM